jgi:hypothetical protein
MCYGRGLLSTQVGQSVHPPNQQGQAQVSYKSQLHGQARHTHTHTDSWKHDSWKHDCWKHGCWKYTHSLLETQGIHAVVQKSAAVPLKCLMDG